MASHTVFTEVGVARSSGGVKHLGGPTVFFLRFFFFAGYVRGVVCDMVMLH